MPAVRQIDFVGGPYNWFYDGLPLGTVRTSPELTTTADPAQIIGDNAGISIQALLHRGGNIFLSMVCEEANRLAVLRARWPFGPTYGNFTENMGCLIQGRVLTAQAAPNSCAVPPFFLARNAVLAPGFTVPERWGTEHREIALMFLLMPVVPGYQAPGTPSRLGNLPQWRGFEYDEVPAWESGIDYQPGDIVRDANNFIHIAQRAGDSADVSPLAIENIAPDPGQLDRTVIETVGTHGFATNSKVKISGMIDTPAKPTMIQMNDIVVGVGAPNTADAFVAKKIIRGVFRDIDSQAFPDFDPAAGTPVLTPEPGTSAGNANTLAGPTSSDTGSSMAWSKIG